MLTSSSGIILGSAYSTFSTSASIAVGGMLKYNKIVIIKQACLQMKVQNIARPPRLTVLVILIGSGHLLVAREVESLKGEVLALLLCVPLRAVRPWSNDRIGKTGCQPRWVPLQPPEKITAAYSIHRAENTGIIGLLKCTEHGS